MSNSYAQSATVSRPQCSKPFDAEIWQIVDSREQPGLTREIQEEL